MRVLVGTLLEPDVLLGIMNVCCLIGFFFIVFGIIGVNLFAGTLRGRCFYDGSDDFLVALTRVNPGSGVGECSIDGGGAICDPGQFCSLSDPISGMPNNNPNYGFVNFDTFPSATLTIFTMITLEGWTDVMYMIMDSFSVHMWAYFVIIIFLGSMIAKNMFLAVISMGYENQAEDEDLQEEMRTRCDEYIKILTHSVHRALMRVSRKAILAEPGIEELPLKLGDTVKLDPDKLTYYAKMNINLTGSIEFGKVSNLVKQATSSTGIGDHVMLRTWCKPIRLEDGERGLEHGDLAIVEEISEDLFTATVRRRLCGRGEKWHNGVAVRDHYGAREAIEVPLSELLLVGRVRVEIKTTGGVSGYWYWAPDILRHVTVEERLAFDASTEERVYALQAKGISNDELVPRLNKFFKFFDEDGSGEMDREEFQTGLRKLYFYTGEQKKIEEFQIAEITNAKKKSGPAMVTPANTPNLLRRGSVVTQSKLNGDDLEEDTPLIVIENPACMALLHLLTSQKARGEDKKWQNDHLLVMFNILDDDASGTYISSEDSVTQTLRHMSFDCAMRHPLGSCPWLLKVSLGIHKLERSISPIVAVRRYCLC